MVFNADEIVKKILDGDDTANDNLTDEEIDELLKHPFYADPDWEPNPPTQEELDAIRESMSHPEATDEEVEEFGSDIGPMCGWCKHETPGTRYTASCAAFEKIPLDILRGFDHRKEHEGDHGIRFELRPDIPQKNFDEWFSFFHRQE